jgi:hypothetical protein
MARTTMTYLISQIEGLLRDTDNELFLDEDAYRINRHKLRSDASRQVFITGYTDLEGVKDPDAGSWTGATTIALFDSRGSGATEVDPDSWDLVRGLFSFTTARGSGALYLDAWVFNPYLAASKLCQRLVLQATITPGYGETGGALVGRYDYGSMAARYLSNAKSTPIFTVRDRRNRHTL